MNFFLLVLNVKECVHVVPMLNKSSFRQLSQSFFFKLRDKQVYHFLYFFGAPHREGPLISENNGRWNNLTASYRCRSLFDRLCLLFLAHQLCAYKWALDRFKQVDQNFKKAPTKAWSHLQGWHNLKMLHKLKTGKAIKFPAVNEFLQLGKTEQEEKKLDQVNKK